MRLFAVIYEQISQQLFDRFNKILFKTCV